MKPFLSKQKLKYLGNEESFKDMLSLKQIEQIFGEGESLALVMKKIWRLLWCNVYFIMNELKWPLRKKSPYLELFWSTFFPQFAAFGLNTERYGLSLRIQSKCRKNADQNNSEYRHFLRRGFIQQIWK